MEKNTHFKKHQQQKETNGDIILPQEQLHEDIAIVTHVSGNSTFKVLTNKGITSTAFLPGKFKKHNKRNLFVSLSSIVLIAFRHFQTDSFKHSDILHIYSHNHIILLHSLFPKFFKTDKEKDEDSEFQFLDG
jgi:translation initiation factor IF-1